MMKLDTDAAKSLRTFAEQHGEIAFAHLVTAALAGEEWAAERVDVVLHQIALSLAVEQWREGADRRLDLIRSTDTTRPDGSIARKLEDV